MATLNPLEQKARISFIKGLLIAGLIGAIGIGLLVWQLTVRDKTIKDVNPAQAYIEGMLWAAYGVRIINGTVAEWQIDKVKECAQKLKEAEIDHSSLAQMEKEEQKRQWKLWLDSTTQGFKDKLKEEGRLI